MGGRAGRPPAGDARAGALEAGRARAVAGSASRSNRSGPPDVPTRRRRPTPGFAGGGVGGLPGGDGGTGLADGLVDEEIGHAFVDPHPPQPGETPVWWWRDVARLPAAPAATRHPPRPRSGSVPRCAAPHRRAPSRPPPAAATTPRRRPRPAPAHPVARRRGSARRRAARPGPRQAPPPAPTGRARPTRLSGSPTIAGRSSRRPRSRPRPRRRAPQLGQAAQPQRPAGRDRTNPAGGGGVEPGFTGRGRVPGSGRRDVGLGEFGGQPPQDESPETSVHALPPPSQDAPDHRAVCGADIARQAGRCPYQALRLGAPLPPDSRAGCHRVQRPDTSDDRSTWTRPHPTTSRSAVGRSVAPRQTRAASCRGRCPPPQPLRRRRRPLSGEPACQPPANSADRGSQLRPGAADGDVHRMTDRIAPQDLRDPPLERQRPAVGTGREVRDSGRLPRRALTLSGREG